MAGFEVKVTVHDRADDGEGGEVDVMETHVASGNTRRTAKAAGAALARSYENDDKTVEVGSVTKASA